MPRAYILLRYSLAVATTALAALGYLMDRARRRRRVVAAAATSGFVADVAHVLRPRIERLVGQTSALLETDLDAGQRHRAEEVRCVGESLLRTVADVVELANLEAGKVEPATRPFAVADVCADVMEHVAADAETKGLELAYHVDPAVPQTLHGDPALLRRVLLNVVGNGVKATAQGEVVVRVRLEAPAARSVVLRVEVADTGTGLTAEERARLFQPFALGNGAASPRSGGAGLGLAISRSLVAMMGGEIGVTSEPGSGSTFWFTVRLACHGTDPVAAPRRAPAGLRTLVVDDNPAARAILEQELRAWGARTNGADDGPTALARLRRGVDQDDPYAVAIVDAGMPGTSGTELARAIAAEPRLRTLPVVLLTPLGRRDPDAGTLPPNVVATVPKPVNGRRLRDAVGVAAAHAPAIVSAGWSARRSRRAAGS